MTRARSVLAILGAVALFPVGFVAAKIAETMVVDPVQKAIPDTLERVFDELFDGERRCPSCQGVRFKDVTPGSAYVRLGIEPVT